jgi:hypothetical protein
MDGVLVVGACWPLLLEASCEQQQEICQGANMDWCSLYKRDKQEYSHALP